MAKEVLQQIQRLVTSELNALEFLEGVSPEMWAELLVELKSLDAHYKEYCTQLDEQTGDPPGTAYEDEYGASIEYYMDASDWHPISKIIRRVKT